MNTGLAERHALQHTQQTSWWRQHVMTSQQRNAACRQSRGMDLRNVKVTQNQNTRSIVELLHQSRHHYKVSKRNQTISCKRRTFQIPKRDRITMTSLQLRDGAAAWKRRSAVSDCNNICSGVESGVGVIDGTPSKRACAEQDRLSCALTWSGFTCSKTNFPAVLRWSQSRRPCQK